MPTDVTDRRRHARFLLAGIIGPTAFISAWGLAAAVTDADYSVVDDAISRRAAVGADTRWLMTGGFVVFGVALPLLAVAVRRRLAGPAWIAAAATGIATLGVAATPLDQSTTVDRLHGVAATVGYVTLAAFPALAARPLRAAGHTGLAACGVAAAGVSSVALALTLADVPTGLFQRLGLTVPDLWIVALAAVWLAERKDTKGA